MARRLIPAALRVVSWILCCIQSRLKSLISIFLRCYFLITCRWSAISEYATNIDKHRQSYSYLHCRKFTMTATTADEMWHLNLDSDHIAWLELDKPNSSANTLSHAAMDALDQRIAELEKLTPRAV